MRERIAAGKAGLKNQTIMQVTSTANVSNPTTSTDTISGPQQTLTQNNFLQLLVAQMENQDPMNPQSDTEMASQMAQFTALQQSTDSSSSLSMLQANSLIGSNVTLQVDSQHTTSGVVQGVQLGASSSDGTPQIVVNGTAYDLKQVLSITPPATGQTASTSSTSPAAN
jgi:flagellar basal-body rod modification protein FlgD